MINKVGNSTNKGDNIIYCVMALEFCLYKEKGNTIVEDKLNEYGIKEQSLVKTLTENISVKIKTEGLENADAQFLAHSQATGGNGLGLYIVQTILNKLHLTYQFIPMPEDRGMSFIIQF